MIVKDTYLRFCILAGILFLFLACGTKGKLKTTGPAKVPKAADLVASLEQYQPDYEWFDGKARVKMETEDIHVGLTMHIRMRKDSLIWIRLEKLGFEIGRALITPDSAYVLDRLNKEYYEEHLMTFLAQYKAPFSFRDLQNVFAGGAVTEKMLEIKPVLRKSNPVLIVEGPEFLAEYEFDSDKFLRRSKLMDSDNRSAVLFYDSYAPVQPNHTIAFERALEIFDGQENASFDFRFLRISFDTPSSMKFEIPAHYAKVE